MPVLKQCDRYLGDDGPAALVIREHLMPVEGADGVLFPATYAAGDNFAGGYNTDSTIGGGQDKDGNPRNVCLIDSVGSQANRIEPLFKEDRYKHLVPQIVVTAGPDREVNLLDAGHRAGDAIVRCSSLKETIDAAFLSSVKGNVEPLAKIAPTSLVFGVWNSRGEQGSQEKRPRLIASTIRAFNVQPLKRSAQYNPPVNYAELDVFSAEDKAKAEGDAKSPLAQRGFVHHPASRSHGGVIATGGIRRDATLGLAALRLLFVGKDEAKTLDLRRYILGLALTAFTHNPSGYLRQGCLLVKNPDKAKENEFVEVYPTGERKAVTLTHEDALKYATEMAKAFVVGESKTVPFDKERAKRDVRGGVPEGDSAKGKISTVDLGTKKFTLGKGAKKKEVSTTDQTTYFKGDAASTFGDVVVKDATVDVALANGIAVKVTGK